MTEGRCFFIICILKLSLVVSEDTNINTQLFSQQSDAILYHLRYKTHDGSERHEEGTLKKTDTGPVLSIAGSYEYEIDGVITVVTYIADENGFRPIIQLRRKINNELPLGFTLDNRIDPKLLGSLAGGGLG